MNAGLTDREPEATDAMNAWIIAALAAVVYAALAHYMSGRAEIGEWPILFVGLPLLLVVVSFTRNIRWTIVACVAALAAFGALAWLWPKLHNPAGWLYFFQHVGINLTLALFFGRTLVGGRRPLVTALASIVHEEMTPALVRYTRQVTVAWTAFFVACAALSVVLFFFADVETWSLFANVLAFPLIGAMFLVENEVRKRVLPKRDQLGLMATVRAVRAAFKS